MNHCRYTTTPGRAPADLWNTAAVILLALFLAQPVTPAAAATAGKYAGEFMSIGVGGRALALGSAFVALTDDVTAGYWNPAGLARLSYPQIGLMHDERFAGLVNYDYGAVAVPLNASSTLALSVIRLGVDNIPDTRDAGVDALGNPLPPDRWEEFAGINPDRITWFNSADWAFYLSYAKRSDDRFSLGANIKFIRRDNGSSSATGIGFDLGALYRVMDRLTVGANIQDVTTTLVAWNTGRNELILPTLKVGGAAAIDVLGSRLTPLLDADIRFEGRGSAANLNVGAVSVDFHGGLEFMFREIAAVRMGYTDIGSVSFGAGVRLPKITVDYSFAKFDADDQLGNTHRISLVFTLESERFLRAGD